MTTDQIQLGDRAKCRITGFSGIVTCITHWLNGCVRYGVQLEEVKDGKIPDATYFDAEQLVLVDRRVHEPMVQTNVPAPKPPVSTTGGPAREGAGFKR
jgi:hypothetical protein